MREIESGKFINEAMGEYGLEIILDRAIPNIIDGFKPSQRRTLWCMHEMGLYGKRTKSANIFGKLMTYHPHGDNYETGVRMSEQAEAFLLPFIDGKGSFGKVYSEDSEAASSRYTEMGLKPIVKEFFKDIKKNPDIMTPNFDGTRKEPLYINAPFPNILTNVQMGIAYGYACNYPSFNLGELTLATIEILHGNNDISKVMPSGDFPTGGEILYDKEEMDKIYTEGNGKIRLRAIKEVKGNTIKVTNIPYTTTIEKVMNSIIAEYERNKLPEITDVRNAIDKDGFALEIDFKRGTDTDELWNKLLALTPLTDNFNVNLTAIYHNKLLDIGVIDIIKIWLDERRKFLKVVLTYELNELKNKLHLLEGLSKIFLDIDKAVKIVRNEKTEKNAKIKLMEAFDIDEVQAEFALEIKLRNFNKDYLLGKTKEISALKRDIKKLEKTIKSGIDKKIEEDLIEVKEKYAKPRKTRIVKRFKELEATDIISEIHDNIKSKIFLSTDKIKKVDEDSKAGSEGYDVYTLSDNDEILVFSNMGRVYKLKVSAIKKNSFLDLDNLVGMRAGEWSIKTSVLDDSFVFIVFENKKIAKFPLSVYETKGNLRCFSKGFNSESPVKLIEILKEDKEVEVFGKKVNTKDYLMKASRVTKGVRIK